MLVHCLICKRPTQHFDETHHSGEKLLRCLKCATWKPFNSKDAARKNVVVKKNPTSRPLAAAGLNSYRYTGDYGYVMIGARDVEDALNEAKRSIGKTPSLKNLERWDGVEYVPVMRGNNPVPPSSRAHEIEKHARTAENLYTAFTGHDALERIAIDKPVMPDVLSVIGDIDGVLYTTVRDGVTESYIHKFKKSSRPLFCVAPDGKSIYMIGGSYNFTERGIVDN
jgi:hypothetical protein